MENLIIKNNSGSENIGSNVLLKIYELALLTSGTLLLSGNIIVPHAKQSVLDYFENNFHDLHITLTGLKYIEFADPVVAWHIAKSYDPDGIGITLSDLNSINWITTSMEGNTQITSFNELSLFININTIKQEAFKGCTSLSSIDLSNITTIELDAFLNCTSLTSIDLSNVTNIGENAFRGCSLLGENETLDLDLDTISLGKNAFLGTKYEGITFHETTKHNLWAADGTNPHLSSMSYLQYLDYSDTKQTAAASRFYCNSLTTLVYPKTVTSVQYQIGSRDTGTSIKYIILLSDSVPTYGYDSYWSFYLGGSGCAFYVPDNMYNSYVSTWTSVPSSRIKPLSELPVGVWKTGLYQLYEPYLSNSSDPAYATT